MARIYGESSKYLTKQGNMFTVRSRVYFYASYAFGVIALIIFAAGLLVGFKSVISQILLPVFAIAAGVLFYTASRWKTTGGHYKQGQQGESEVLEVLGSLPDNFAIFCDVKFPKKNFNIDFLVTGPTGIFAVEVKSWNGTITQHTVPAQSIHQVLQNAFEIKNHIAQKTKQELFIEATLVYSNDSANVSTFKKDHVTVLHKKYITAYIAGRQEIHRINLFTIENYLIALTAHNSFS